MVVLKMGAGHVLCEDVFESMVGGTIDDMLKAIYKKHSSSTLRPPSSFPLVLLLLLLLLLLLTLNLYLAEPFCAFSPYHSAGVFRGLVGRQQGGQPK